MSVADGASNCTTRGLVVAWANLQLGINSVLLVRLSVVPVPTRVVVAEGMVTVLPPLVIVARTGAVSVLLVNVSVVLRPTSVSGPVGKVSVPPLVMMGAVSVLLVSVCVAARVTTVSLTSGKAIARSTV